MTQSQRAFPPIPVGKSFQLKDLMSHDDVNENWEETHMILIQ